MKSLSFSLTAFLATYLLMLLQTHSGRYALHFWHSSYCRLHICLVNVGCHSIYIFGVHSSVFVFCVLWFNFSAFFTESNDSGSFISMVASIIAFCTLCTLIPFVQHSTYSLVTWSAFLIAVGSLDYFSHHFLATYTIYELQFEPSVSFFVTTIIHFET